MVAGGRKAARTPMACRAAICRLIALGPMPTDRAIPRMPSPSRTPLLKAAALARAASLPLRPADSARRRPDLKARNTALKAGHALALVILLAVSSLMSGIR